MYKLNRREFALSAVAASLSAVSFPLRAEEQTNLQAAFEGVEKDLGCRLGVMIRDIQDGREWLYRPWERFPLNSTFKTFACAALLAKTEAGKKDLEQEVSIQPGDLVTYSPVTGQFAGKQPMTLHALCEATMTTSDNTAANLILDQIGGPQGFTEFMRSIGDDITRLDRWETELNEGIPGDLRDSTTPRAVSQSLETVLFGGALSSASRMQLEDWMTDNRVSGPLLRAGLPENWRIADRSGAGGHGSRSIIACIRPPKRKPLMAAIYLTETGATMERRNKAIAGIGRSLAKVM